MKYTIDWIIGEYKNKRPKYIFFWGHRPNKDGSIGQSCLSQWWEAPFQKDDIVFNTAEHWMMHQKAILFKDDEIAEKILQADTPAEAKKLGRQVRNFEQKIWERDRFDIVSEGNMLKFSQHEELAHYLRKTNSRILVEASPVDTIWGIGKSKDDPGIENPETWEGLNLLGFALMEVRDWLST